VGFAPTFYFGLEKMQNISVNERVSEIAADAAGRNGVEFIHLEIIGSKRNPTLRVFVDKPGGVTLDDCSAVSRDFEAALDAEDLISQTYTLEVSSPGLERELYSLSDFEKFTGQKAKVKLKIENGARKSYSGRITGIEGNEVVFDDRTVGNVRFPFESVAKANLRVDLEDEFKRRR